MSSRQCPDSGGVTLDVALIAGAIIISLVMYTLLIHPSFATGQSASTGMNALTDNLALSGHVHGYADMTAGLTGGGSANNPVTAGRGISLVRFSLRLATLRMNWQPGTGDDLSQALVVFSTTDTEETLPLRSGTVLERPGWSIASKNGILPGKDADTDMLLEPGEQFGIVIAPSATIPPGTPFSVVIRVPGAQPLELNRTVPAAISPVMDLG